MLARPSLDRLMPLFVELDGRGRIVAAGPSLRKMLAPVDPSGQPFADLFELRRPSGPATMSDLGQRIGERFHASLIYLPAIGLRGIAVPLAAGKGLLINFSFGIGVVEAVRRFDLTEADFAPTDLAVEMLYLVEAKATVTAELRRMNSRLQNAKSAAEEQALSDALTGLRNRRALDSALRLLLAEGVDFGMMHLDLDYFKSVNDTLGHAAGDQVLCQVARILRAQTRSTDTVARVGGDEFVIVLPDLCDPDALAAIAQRIIANLSEPIDFDGTLARVSASIGIALSTDYLRPTAHRLLCDADDALYASKRGGRGQAQFAASGEGRSERFA